MPDYKYPWMKREEERKAAKILARVSGPSIKSVKRLVEEKLYKKIVAEFLKEDPLCEIMQYGCTKVATGLHHIQKRTPKNYTDRNNLMRACDNCNGWVEKNPLQAIKLGFSKSKHIKTD